MSLDTRTLTTRLITDTTATVTKNVKVSYTYPKNKTGFANTYSILGMNVSIETTKERGWDLYVTDIRISYKGHWGSPDGFSDWFKNLKTSLGNASNNLVVNNTCIDRHSLTKLQEAHDIGVIAGESFVLTIINKYVELLFNNVEKENIERQINALQSQLATIA
jgi:hypothetical protein